MLSLAKYQPNREFSDSPSSKTWSLKQYRSLVFVGFVIVLYITFVCNYANTHPPEDFSSVLSFVESVVSTVNMN